MESKEKKSKKCPVCGKFIGQEKIRKYEDLVARANQSDVLVVANGRLRDQIERLAEERRTLEARLRRLESQSLFERIFRRN